MRRPRRPAIVAQRVEPRAVAVGADARRETLAEALASVLYAELRGKSTTTVHSGRGLNHPQTKEERDD